MTSMKVDLLKQVYKTQQKNQESTDHQHRVYEFIKQFTNTSENIISRSFLIRKKIIIYFIVKSTIQIDHFFQ